MEWKKLNEKIYYCNKCKYNHRYSSKIGKQHLQYKEEEVITLTPRETINEENIVSTINNENIKIEKGNKLTRFIQGYRNSYRNGVEKFGLWWKIFQLSIWGFVLIFILTAVIIFVVYLPKIEMIYWDLL